MSGSGSAGAGPSGSGDPGPSGGPGRVSRKEAFILAEAAATAALVAAAAAAPKSPTGRALAELERQARPRRTFSFFFRWIRRIGFFRFSVV